jgi:hypothetical protein
LKIEVFTDQEEPAVIEDPKNDTGIYVYHDTGTFYISFAGEGPVSIVVEPIVAKTAADDPEAYFEGTPQELLEVFKGAQKNG